MSILQKHTKNIIAIILVGVVVGFFAFVFLGEKNSGPPPFIHPKVLLNPPDGVYTIPEITAEDHIWGSPSAPVKIIEYSDTECPFCKRNYNNLKSLVHEYNGDIAWVYRHHTLDHRYTKSRTEAEASECAAQVGGEGAFWLFLDQIYGVTESNDSLDLSLLPSFVGKFGVDTTAFQACMDNGDTKDIVERQNREAFVGGLEFTPSMVIFWPDGERRSLIIGARDRDTIRAAIDFTLGKEISTRSSIDTNPAEERSYSE